MVNLIQKGTFKIIRMSETCGRRRIDRYAERLQHKIQTEINLRDDEIQRLDQLLGSYKQQIVKMRDDVRKLDTALQIKTAEISGRKRFDETKLKSEIAQKESHHNHYLAELEKLHKDETNALQVDFEDRLNRFHKFSQDQLDEQADEFKEQIESLIEGLQATKRSITELNAETEPNESGVIESQEIHGNLIGHLQEIVSDKHEERKLALFTAREQLREVIGVLDEMDRQHACNTLTIKDRMQRQSDAYETALVDLERERNSRIALQRKLLATAQSREKQLQAKLIKIKEKHNEKLAATVNELQYLKEQTPRKCENVDKNELVRIETKKRKLTTTRVILADKERALEEAREENTRLSRALAQMRHRVRFGNM